MYCECCYHALLLETHLPISAYVFLITLIIKLIISLKKLNSIDINFSVLVDVLAILPLRLE